MIKEAVKKKSHVTYTSSSKQTNGSLTRDKPLTGIILLIYVFYRKQPKIFKYRLIDLKGGKSGGKTVGVVISWYGRECLHITRPHSESIMIRHGTDGKSDKRPPRRDFFSKAFHADHASSDNLGFNKSDGDLSWAAEQLNQEEDCQRHALHQQINDKFKIKPKVQKIDDDDETWFSEASDAEGSIRAIGPRKGKKKRRKAGAPGTKSPSGVRDNALLQHPNSKGGDDSSDEEDLFEFAADFGACGEANAFVGDLIQSSANDDHRFESSHSSRTDPFSQDFSSAHGGPIRSSPSTSNSSSNVSGEKTAFSSTKKGHKNFTMLPVPSSPKTTKRMQSGTSCSVSLPDMDLSEGAADNDDLFLTSFVDTVMEQELKFQHDNQAKVSTSITRVAAGMNKKSSEQDKRIEPSPVHSNQLANMFPAKKMYITKQRSALDPLSSSDHGPSRHSHGTEGGMMKTSRRTKLVRQTSDHIILDKSTASLNASSLLNGSSSLETSVSVPASQLGLHANQLLQASHIGLGVGTLDLLANQPLSASRSTFHPNQPVAPSTSGTPENKRCVHTSQPIKSFQPSDKPRRKVVRKVVRTASGESGVGEPPRRRHVPSQTNSMSGSSDDGGEEDATHRIARRRPSNSTNSTSRPSDDSGEECPARKVVRRRPSNNTALSGSQDKGALLKKKIVRRRASDSAGVGGKDSNHDNTSATGSAKSGVVRERRRVSMQDRSGSSEISKALQVGTTARATMAKLQAEIKQGGLERKMKTKTASQTSTSLDSAIQNDSHPARRVLKMQNSAHSMPAASISQSSVGTPTRRQHVSQPTDNNTKSRNPDQDKQAIRANMTVLDQHMVKRRPVRKSGGPSGSASLAGHEMTIRKKKAPIRSASSDLASKLPGGGPRFSGSASVAGDQVASRQSAAKHFMKKKPGGLDDRKPLSSSKPRLLRTQQRQNPAHSSSFNEADSILQA